MSVAIDNQAASASGIFSEVEKIMQRGVEEGVFPGAVLIVGQAGHELYARAFGERSARYKGSDGSVMQFDTVFDVASLTHIMVTATLVMKLVESGKLKLEDKIPRFIEGFSVYNKSDVTIAHLLSHSSGLPHWAPYFEELLRANAGSRMGIMTSRGAREYIVTQLKRSQLKSAPGSRQIYSDLGYILLGHIVELLTGMSLDRAAYHQIFHALGLRTTSFVDLSLIRRRGIHPVKDMIAPTEDCSWRKRVLCGEVHDDNAWAMGGIAGHSGLFSTASDVHRFASELIAAYRGQSSFLTSESVATLWGGVENLDSAGWQFGWDTPSKENGMDESKLSSDAVGMCGFTGCSLWIEPASNLDIVLMSNRINPSRSNKKIRALRPELHSAVVDAIGKL